MKGNLIIDMNPPQAREFYLEALEDNKNDISLYLNIALSYSIEGDYQNCRQWAEKGLLVDSKNSDVEYFLGISEIKLKNVKKGVQHL